MKNSLLTPKATARVAASTWRSRALSLLDVILVLGTSVQLGLHFWPSSALIFGIRIDYLSPTLYLFDLLLLTSLLLHRRLHFSAPFLLLALSNLLFALVPLQSAIWWLRLLLWVTWLRFLPRNPLLPRLLVFWLGFLCLLGLTQLILGHTLQGPFYWLGERRLDLGQPGIALQEIFGVKYLRAYSIFSHPNIFAGWSVLITMLIFTLSPLAAPGFLILTSVAVILAASRSAALSLLIFLLIRSRSSLRHFLLFSLPALLVIPFLVRPESVVLPRLTLLASSLQIFRASPIFGAGVLGNFSAISATSPLRLLQPDHFTPTLLLSWLGLVGLLQLCLVIGYSKIDYYKLKSLAPLLPLLIFDHYLLTSLPGLVMLVLLLYTTFYETSSSH